MNEPMNTLALKVKQEVRLMFELLYFRASEGAYVEGELAAIEIVPKRKKEVGLCDLHLRIIPYNLERDVPAEVLAGAREACKEALFDPKPNVQFAARHYLASLKVTKRVRLGEMAGLPLSLYVKSELGDEYLIEGLTDKDGAIWFSDVSLEAFCQPAVAVQALAAQSDQQQPRAEGESRVFPLLEGRVIALLEEMVGGGAVLTVETEAEEFNGATVRFEWGRESGEIKMEPSETGETWSGQCNLTCSFQELAVDIPTFEIIMPQQA